ncbi:ATP-dependent DNA helicase RecQ [Candidatus Uhrbacteria bacterium]|nr:ATP-dependent DNA helicase RecQ [Candidatus Uhrbacteria bacterium]
MSFFSFRSSVKPIPTPFEPFSVAPPQELLKQYWGFSDFRHGQKEVVDAVLAGRDTLAVMPTGAGKSLCYQLPALTMSGVSVIVSPLIALMKDQVGALKARNIPAEFVNSTLELNEIAAIMDAVASGAVRILYIAPERFGSKDFVRTFVKFPVALFAIDEAHCVSHWGHDFRSDYLALKDMVKKLACRPVVVACTATATPEVKDDIVEQLGLQSPEVFVRGFDRPNLVWRVMMGLVNYERDAQLLHLVKNAPGSGIVYSGTRDRAAELAELLCEEGIEALPYHAGLDAEVRRGVQDSFMSGNARVIVATVAFGMGIDKPDVRFVIHAAMPGSLEAYYQEAGRAGRDGKPAQCVLLHSWADKNLQEFFIKKGFQDMLKKGQSKYEAEKYAALRTARLERMIGYVTTRQCRRRKILEYFGDPDAFRIRNCQGCDVCLRANPGP